MVVTSKVKFKTSLLKKNYENTKTMLFFHSDLHYFKLFVEKKFCFLKPLYIT